MIPFPDLNELNKLLVQVQTMQDRVNQIMAELHTTKDQNRIIQLNIELQNIVKQLEVVKNAIMVCVPTMSFEQKEQPAKNEEQK
jgi:hypothetical protein